MKKTIATFSAMMALFASMNTAKAQDGFFPVDSIVDPSLSLVSVSTSVGYESQYVFRGVKYAGHSIQPKVDFSYPVLGFDLYAGAWSNFPIKSTSGSNLKEIDVYGGAIYTYGMAKLDVGYICYWYPESSDWGGISRDMEVNVGLTFDTSAYLGGINLNPSIYYTYNWILKQQVVEISVGYNAPIGEWTFGWSKLTLPITIYGGYSSAARMNGDDGGRDEGKTWWYVGGSVDIAYAITEYCTISGGVRYCHRTGGNEGENYDGFHYALEGRADNFWFGGKVDFGF